MKKPILIVNFGGPRTLDEVEPFLVDLLTDEEVIRTSLPRFFEKRFFTRVAKKRTLKVRDDYEVIGGKSPIFEDTETIAREVAKLTGRPVLTFHRYLRQTHAEFLEKFKSLSEEVSVFPLFPQFSYATTGSIARFFKEHLGEEAHKLSWIKSYAAHPAYIDVMECCIRDFMQAQNLEEEKIALLFSAHGLPRKFIREGDCYERESELSFQALSQKFPQAICKLSYQSKFGRGEWLRPYTDEVCRAARAWTAGREHVVVVPLAFTSDHIETLFEIEKLYLPSLHAQGLHAHRCPALNLRPDWLSAIAEILEEQVMMPNASLVRRR